LSIETLKDITLYSQEAKVIENKLAGIRRDVTKQRHDAHCKKN